MKAIVDQETCVGCALCEQVCPAVFVMKDGKAEVKVATVPKEAEADCRKAVEDCPVTAIKVE